MRSKLLGDGFIERVLSNGRPALTKLIKKLIPIIQESIKATLFRHRWQADGRNIQQEIDDFVQDTLISLLNNDAHVLRSWDPDLGLSLASYVRLVAERQVSSALRTGKRNPWKESPCIGPSLERATCSRHAYISVNLSLKSHDIEGQYESKEILATLCSHFEKQLSLLGQTIFTRLYIDEKTINEICDELGMSSDAVYAWKSRLARHARSILGENEKKA